MWTGPVIAGCLLVAVAAAAAACGAASEHDRPTTTDGGGASGGGASGGGASGGGASGGGGSGAFAGTGPEGGATSGSGGGSTLGSCGALPCFPTPLHFTVPIVIDPGPTQVASWPITFGVPFPEGSVPAGTALRVVDETAQAQPVQIDVVADWEDGSVRWAHVSFVADLVHQYTLEPGDGPGPQPDDIVIEQLGDGFAVTTGPARYTFATKAGSFTELALDLDASGTFEPSELLLANAGEAFRLRDSLDRIGTLGATSTVLEQSGPRHAVVRIEGEYRDSKDARLAAGVVYLHLFAGLAQARVEHKLIVSEDTTKLWFKQVWLELPFATGGAVKATFNTVHHDTLGTDSLAVPTGSEAMLLQDEYPHFGSTKSHFSLRLDGEPVKEGEAAGDWADASLADRGVAAQVPAFAEQYPKAFRVSEDGLRVDLWSSAGGLELNYDPGYLLANYFGNDWIPQGAAFPYDARGVAKTHTIWLHPHAGTLGPAHVAQFAGTRQEVFAQAAPAWIAGSGVFGPIRERDDVQFPGVEAQIDDYFTRLIFVSQQVFPPNGYLSYGMYPYVQQAWELIGNRWYPEVHRLGGGLDYNLRRMVWALWARSADRKYYDYARRYTRIQHDLMFSNWGNLTKGAVVIGGDGAPIVWGSKYGSAVAGVYGRASHDVIQFSYDWFFSGDRHSRDMFLHWKKYLKSKYPYEQDPVATGKSAPQSVGAGNQPDWLLRFIGSAYEFDHDPAIYAFGHAMLAELVHPSPQDLGDILNPAYLIVWSKEALQTYYDYYVATGDPLAHEVVMRRAELLLRYRWPDSLFQRHTADGLMAGATALLEQDDPAWSSELATTVTRVGSTEPWLAAHGMSPAQYTQTTTDHWGHRVADGNHAYALGLPHAMQAVANSSPPLQAAEKHEPVDATWLTFVRPTTDPQYFDLSVTLDQGTELGVTLTDLVGNPQPIELQVLHSHRIGEPDAGNQGMSPYYLLYETLMQVRLEVPSSVPPGQYRIGMPDGVAFRVLRSGAAQLVHEAPNGLLVQPGETLYFDVPKGSTNVTLFAHRQVQLYDPNGAQVALTPLFDPAQGYYDPNVGRYALTASPPGTWSLRTGTDADTTEDTLVSTFVRLDGIPNLFALDDPARLFALAGQPLPRGSEYLAPPLTAKVSYQTPGRFGEGRFMGGRVLSVPNAPQFPYGEGTVEFWLEPSWSSTQWAYENSTHLLRLFRAGPTAPECCALDTACTTDAGKACMSLVYTLEPDNGGRTGRYNLSYLRLLTWGVEPFTAYPARLFLTPGRWYHLAASWRIDGNATVVNLFVDGRRKAYYQLGAASFNGVAASAAFTMPLPTLSEVRIGGNHYYGKFPRGQALDEIRISSKRRYTDDFVPPTAPFVADGDTWLLLHLDGDLAGQLNGQPVVANDVPM